MKNVILTIGILLFVVACGTQLPEDLNEVTTNPITKTPLEVSIIIDKKTYGTILGSYC